MDASTRVTLSNVTLGFGVTLTVLAVSAAAVTAVAFFILSAPQIIIIGGVVATALLTGGAITLFVKSYLLRNTVTPTSPLISTNSIHQIATDSIPAAPLTRRLSSGSSSAITATQIRDSNLPDSTPSNTTNSLQQISTVLPAAPLTTTLSSGSSSAITATQIRDSNVPSFAPPPFIDSSPTTTAPAISLAVNSVNLMGPSSAPLSPSSENLIVLINRHNQDPQIIAPLSQTIEPYIFNQSVYKVQEPDDTDLPEKSLQIVEPPSTPIIEEVEESTPEKDPIFKAADLSIVLAAPQKQAIPAPILTLALAAGAAAHTAGVGAAALEAAIASYLMSTLVNPASWALTRYVVAQGVQAAASGLIATPVLGISLPVIANAGVAIGTAVAAAHVGIFLYNRVTSKDNRLTHSGTGLTIALRYLGLDEKAPEPTT